MPCLEITLPKTDHKTKEKIALMLTEAFASSTSLGADIFGIRFSEYAPGEAAIGGKLVSEMSDRPYLHFLLYCPRLKRSVKQNVVAALSEAFTSATEKERWIPTIHISEHPYDNIGVGGKLLTDAFEECAKRTFYYELPKD